MNNQEIDEKVSVLKSILIKTLGVVGIALALGAIYVGYQQHLESKNAKAAELFYEAHSMEQSAADKPQTPEELGQMKSFDAEKVAAWDAAKLDAYQKILAKIDEDYAGTATWAISQMRRGKIALVQKNFDGAEGYYRSVVEKMGKEPLFYGLASDALGVLLEDQGRHEKALEVFHAAAESNKNPLKPLALLGEARALQALNKPGADKVLDRVIKEFPETPYSRRAKILRTAGAAVVGAR